MEKNHVEINHVQLSPRRLDFFRSKPETMICDGKKIVYEEHFYPFYCKELSIFIKSSSTFIPTLPLRLKPTHLPKLSTRIQVDKENRISSKFGIGLDYVVCMKGQENTINTMKDDNDLLYKQEHDFLKQQIAGVVESSLLRVDIDNVTLVFLVEQN